MKKLVLGIIFVCSLFHGLAQGNEKPKSGEGKLTHLTLEELLETPIIVTTASRREEQLKNAPAVMLFLRPLH